MRQPWVWLILWCFLLAAPQPAVAMLDCSQVINQYYSARKLSAREQATLDRYRDVINTARKLARTRPSRFRDVDRYQKKIALASGDEVFFNSILNGEGRLVTLREVDIFVTRKAGDPPPPTFLQMVAELFRPKEERPGLYQRQAETSLREVGGEFRKIRQDLFQNGYEVLILQGKRITGGRIANKANSDGREFAGQFYLQVFDLNKEFSPTP